MKRSSNDHILTTIVGSLARPDDLTELLIADRDDPAFDSTPLEPRIRSAVAEAVARQAAVGIDVVADGEQSKLDFIDYVLERAEGFGEPIEVAGSFGFTDMVELTDLLIAQLGDNAYKFRPVVEDLAYTDAGRALVARDIANLKAAVEQTDGVVEGFLPSISPGVLSLLMPNQHYASHEEFVYALADLMHEEYKAITDAGIIVQIDAPDLAASRNMITGIDEVKQRMGDRPYRELLADATNHALRGIDPELVRVHLCYANYMGPHVHDLPMHEVLDVAFGIDACGFSFEGANAAHAHEWKIFETLEVPDGKVIIPGLVDSKSQVVEHPELVAQRIEQYVRLVGSERFIAGPDCGFGTVVGVHMVHPKIGWMKLDSLAKGAALASDRVAKAGA